MGHQAHLINTTLSKTIKNCHAIEALCGFWIGVTAVGGRPGPAWW